jgi:hypothetical protein
MFDHMSGYLTLDRVRHLPAGFLFLLIAVSVVAAEPKRILIGAEPTRAKQSSDLSQLVGEMTASLRHCE